MPASGKLPTRRKVQRYGWVPDIPDHRDRVYAVAAPVALPPKIDLSDLCPEIYDQGNLGSCTANAIAAAMQFGEDAQNISDQMPSRLFVYYNERAIEGTIGTDSGAQLRDGIKSVADQGACAETVWLYDISQYATTPPDGCYASALSTKAITYESLPQDLSTMKACLNEGFPFIFGFVVFADFESPRMAATGIGQLPAPTDVPVGGHAVMAVGYDDSDDGGRFLIRNSWGTAWGKNGYFTFPYSYLTNQQLANDFWTIRKVT